DRMELVGIEPTPLTRGFEFMPQYDSISGYVHIEAWSSHFTKKSGVDALMVAIFKIKQDAQGKFPLELMNPGGDIYDAALDAGRIFSRAADAEIERTLRLGRSYVHEDGSLRVPIHVDTPFGIRSFGLELDYAVEEMLFLGIQGTRATREFFALDGTEIDPGLLRIGGFGLSAIQMMKPAVLCELVFSFSGRDPDIRILRTFDDLEYCEIR
ncbi:hypothetical protein KAU08_01080, partial [bacterium]|nr:hypothetical protein [bacterium]